jgi:hypothetical protein
MADTTLLIHDKYDESAEVAESIIVEKKSSFFCYYCMGFLFCLCTLFGIIMYILIFLSYYN